MSTMKNLVLVVAITALAMSTAQAVDIQGFDSSTACSGSGYTFSGIAQQVCTQFATTEGAVQIRDLSSCQTGTAYSGGGCTTSSLSGNGPDVQCFIGGGFTGAAWFNNCRRKLQSATTTPKCTSHAAPTGVHYTDSEGSWILHTPNAADMLALLRAVEDAEKAEWLKAQGAHFINA